MVANVKIVQKAVIIFENKILVVRRSKDDSFRADDWDFPGGNVDDRDVERVAWVHLDERAGVERKARRRVEVRARREGRGLCCRRERGRRRRALGAHPLLAIDHHRGVGQRGALLGIGRRRPRARQDQRRG